MQDTSPPPRRLRPWTLAALALALLLSARAAACGPEAGTPEPDAETWTLRDLLTLSTQQRPIPQDQHPDLRRRLVQAASDDQGEELEDASPFQPRPEDPYFPTDPLGTLARLDKRRLDFGEDVRLFGVYGRDEHGAWSAPCEPEPGDLLDEQGHLRTFSEAPDAWPDRWQPWAPWAQDADPARLDQLRALAPALTAWAERCGDLREDLPPLDGTLALQPEEHAPYLLAWWPQRRKLYLHPLLLDLLVTPQPRAAAASDLRTQRSPLTTDDLDACVTELTATCDQCDTQAEINQNPGTCQNLFPNSSIASDCATLRDQVRDGYALFCAFRIYQNRPTVEACVQNATGAACDRQNVPVSSVSTLVQAYAPFNNPSTAPICFDQLAACANPTQPGNNTPGNNNTPEPEPPACGGAGAECEEPGFADDCPVCVWCQDDSGEDLNSFCGCDDEEEEDPAASEEDDSCCGGDE